MFLKSIYRRILLRAAYNCYLNVCWLYALIRPFLGTIFWKLWFRWAPISFYSGPYRPYVPQNPSSFFTVDGCVDDLAKLWYNFDFDEDLSVLKRLVNKYGVNLVLRTVDSLGKTASHWIAESGTRTALKYVVKVDPSIVEMWHNDQTLPVMHLALLNYNIETADSLVYEYHLSPSFKDKYGLNALMRASSGIGVYKPQDVILRCYIFGIDVNSQTATSGLTALHYAVQSHSQQSVYLLLRLGANPALTDYSGRTPYHYAIRYGNLKLAYLLATSAHQKSINIFQKVWMYFCNLFYSTSARFSEGRFWIGVCITTVQLFVTFGYLLPQFFNLYFDVNSYLHLQLCVTMALTILAGYLTVFKDSGFIPTGSSEYFKLMRYLMDPSGATPLNRGKTLNCLNENLSANLCHICECIIPVKAKHCYHCNRCCLEYDHHCVFLFTCIGRSNVFSFMAFTGFMAISGFQGILVVLLHIVDELKSRPYYAHLFENGLFNWTVIQELYFASRILHFLDIMLSFKYVIIGATLCIVTYFKWRYLCHLRKKIDMNESVSTNLTYH